MSAPALSPEECYQRALKLMQAGQLGRAIKLLKIATLKAPSDPRFRDALHQATQAQKDAQEQTANADPRALLEEARARIADGDTETARKLLQIARARDPKDPEIRAAAEQLRAKSDAPRAETDAHTKALKDVTEQATEEIKSPPPPPKPSSIPAPSRARLLALVGALVVVLAAGAAVFFLTQTERGTDASPYAGILPVQDARSIGTDGEEVVLVVSRAEWGKLDGAARKLSLQKALQQAIVEGHKAVFVYDEGSALLGSANTDAVYLP